MTPSSDATALPEADGVSYSSTKTIDKLKLSFFYSSLAPLVANNSTHDSLGYLCNHAAHADNSFCVPIGLLSVSEIRSAIHGLKSYKPPDPDN